MIVGTVIEGCSNVGSTLQPGATPLTRFSSNLSLTCSSTSFEVHCKVRAIGGEPFGQAAVGYDHGYDTRVFCLRMVLDPAYMEGYVES